jgi:uncharacterized protein
VILYFILVYGVSWALWFAANAVTAPFVRTVLIYTGVFTPGIVALVLTRLNHGSVGVQRLLARLIKFDVGARWFVFALFFMAAIKLLVALIVRVVTGAWPTFGTEPLPLMFVAAIGSALLGGQIGEELGWRGYALPRLARPLGLGPASIVLGVIWAAWHLPLFYILGGDTVGQSFPFYLAQVVALSIVIAWVYMKTNGSLSVTMLLHAAVNNTKDIVPSAVPGASDPWSLQPSFVGWLTLALLWLCAIGFLYDMLRDTSVARLADAPVQ